MIVLLLGLTGCAEYALDAENAMEAGTTYDDTANFDSGMQEDNLLPGYFAVRAELVVDELGETSVQSLRAEVVAEDGLELMCSFNLPVSWQNLSPPDGEPIFLWGRTDVDDSQACAELPSWLALGIGELGPDVRARLGAVGLDASAGALYGAYVQLPGGEVEIFGYAGTTDGIAGVGEAVEPPGPGLYSLQPLYLLPLPATD